MRNAIPGIETIRRQDPSIAQAIDEEGKRQQESLELIPSENVVSRAVLEAQGSVLTNKYAEGYPGKRYYGGCEFVDKVEALAIERARTLFCAEGVNVQPHSGSQANMAVYLAALQPGDTILGMDLAHGGHLTHGSKVNFSGILYKSVSYGVRREDGRIDFEQVRSLAREHRPKMIIAGASSYPRAIDYPVFAEIAKEVGAYLFVDMAHTAGLVAAKVLPSPIPVADFVTCTTHKTLRGPRGGMIFFKENWAKAINGKIFPGIQGGPLMHVIAGKAVALEEAKSESYRRYQHQVVENCQVLARGLVDRGFDLVTGGTDTHLVLVDLRNRSLTGKEAEALLDRAGLTVNKNTVPFETQSPFVTSGIRLGTPTITSRGMGREEMVWLAEALHRVLESKSDTTIHAVRKEVLQLCERFPLYRDA